MANCSIDRRSPLPATRRRFAWLFLASVVALALTPATGLGGVVIVANRTRDEIPFTVQVQGRDPRAYRVASGDLVAVPVISPVRMAYRSEDIPYSYVLDPNTACCFLENDLGELELHQIGLGAGMVPPLNESLARSEVGTAKSAIAVGTVPVRVYIDDEGQAHLEALKNRITERLHRASDIFEKHCRMRFEIVEFDEWHSDNAVNDFEKSLAEFERETYPADGGIALGFTCQYQRVSGSTHLGGTRAALHPYVFIREWPQHINEPERLEVLVHELGHYFGATHSPEPNSVMRPMLGDRQARRVKFRIGFDPINALAMNLVAEELRGRQITRLSEVSRGTKENLRAIYHDMAHALPQDPASQQFLRMLSEYYLVPSQRKPQSVLKPTAR